MAPEQATAKVVDKRVDIYALGVVLYEMVTGRKPFMADTPMAVLIKQATEPLPRPKQFVPSLPDEVEKILLKALAKQPENRFQSMEEFAQAFRKSLSGKQAKELKGPQRPPTRAEETATIVEFPTKVQVRTETIRSSRTPGHLRWWIIGIAVSMVVILIVILNGFISALPKSNNGTAVAILVTTPSDISDTQTPELPTVTPLPTLTRLPALVIGSRNMISPKDGMKLLYVPAGNFLMGSTDADTNAQPEEKPQHTVYLDAFWIDQTDVTNKLYALCVSDGICTPPSNTSYLDRPSYYGNFQFDNYPVVYVTWDDATAYCKWAGRQLPSEAQWEKAARGTDGRIYPWGNQAPDDTLLNWHVIAGDTTAVGSYPKGASPYGALDMAGNVWQWVNDWYSDTYYQSSPASNPLGPVSGQYRVYRGGAPYTLNLDIRSAIRGANKPTLSYYSIGFRCSR